MEKRVPELSRSSHNPRRAISDYLVKSDKWYLYIVGISIQFFGLKAIIGFLLGTVAVYAYANFKPLPTIVQPPAIVQPPEVVTLSGKVKTYENKPLKDYQIGILQKAPIPTIKTEDGSFSLEVPPREKYDIVVWSTDLKIAQIYTGREAFLDREDTYCLKSDLAGFPQNLGIVDGQITDITGGGFECYVEIAGKFIRTKPDGSFVMTGIPIGNVTLRVYKTPDDQPLCVEPITVELTGPTWYETQVKGGIDEETISVHIFANRSISFSLVLDVWNRRSSHAVWAC